MSKALLIIADPRFGLLLPKSLQSGIVFKAPIQNEEKEIIPFFADCEPKYLQKELLNYLQENPEDSVCFPEFFSAIEMLTQNYPESENRVEISDELFALIRDVIDSTFNQLLLLEKKQMILIVV